MLNPPYTDNKDLDAFLQEVYRQVTDSGYDSGVPPPSGNPVPYPEQYIHIKYADSNVGTGMSNLPANKYFWGLRNSSDSVESSNPADYQWFEFTPGFGTTYFVYYTMLGVRTVKFQVAVNPPTEKWVKEPFNVIDLDKLVLPKTIVSGDINVAHLQDISVYLDGGIITDSSFDTGTIGGSSFDTGSITNSSFDNGSVTNTSFDNGTISTSSIASSTVSDSLVFTPVSPQTHVEGKVFYDSATHSLAYYNDESDITVNIGREELIRVYNNTGSTILNGSIAYISGAFNDIPSIALANASTVFTSGSTIGMATHDIHSNSYGYITSSGMVNDISTLTDASSNTLVEGDELFLSSVVSGGFTKVAPLQPSFVISVGYVVHTDALGKVFIKIDRKPWYPSLHLINTTSGVALPTVPTVFKFPTVDISQGFSYNASTGIVTTLQSGTHTLVLMLNATPSAANKKVYYYAEENKAGAGWVIVRYSARVQEIANGAQTQLTIPVSYYWATDTQVRFYIWSDATVTLNSTDLPGTTPGTVTLPAARLTWA